jgi:hypothetical protein
MKDCIPVSRILLIAMAVCLQTTAGAQSARFEVATTQKTFDGLSMNIKPGDTVFITAGEREELVLQNITGTTAKPVVVINRGGKVIIRTDQDYGILFNNSVHFKLTGTGSRDEYGFEIAATANHGLVVTKYSSFCEAENLEIHHVGYAGIVAKTDPNCTRKDLRYFIMQQLSFHHNLIHDTKAEGFYVGYSWYPARYYECGTDSLLYSHEIHGIRIYDNNMYNTGQEGIQVGTGTRDVKIYSNKVYNYGVTNTVWQNHGIQIGQGTTGDFFNNSVSTGPGEAVSLFGGGNNRVYKNIIINSGAAAIYQNDRGAVPGSTYQIINNTIINPKEYGISVVSDHTTGNIISGNTIVISNTDRAILNTGRMQWDTTGNKIFANTKDAGIADPSTTRFEPIATRYPFLKDETFELLIVPTPAGNRYPFRLTITNPSIKLYNGAGILMEGKIIAGKTNNYYELDLSSLVQGVYYIAIASGNKPRQLRRILVKNDRP